MRSASTIEARDNTARAVASWVVSNDDIVSVSTTSRTPSPAGAKTTTKPAAHASANAPVDCTTAPIDGSSISGQPITARCRPKHTYVTTDAPTVSSMPRRLGTGNARSRRSTRPASDSSRRCTPGTSTRQISGASASNHHRERSCSASTHGSVSAAMTTAVTASSSSWFTNAARIERRAMP